MDQSKNPNNRRMPPRRPPQRGMGPGNAPRNNQPPQKPKSSLDNSDTVNVTGKAGHSRNEPPPIVAKNIGNELYGPSTTVKVQEDGTKIVKYSQPQKLNKLLKDAKAQVGGESSRFFGKGWVIGEGVAKISPDGSSITYYSTEVADLVRDLLGPDSETI